MTANTLTTVMPPSKLVEEDPNSGETIIYLHPDLVAIYLPDMVPPPSRLVEKDPKYGEHTEAIIHLDPKLVAMYLQDRVPLMPLEPRNAKRKPDIVPIESRNAKRKRALKLKIPMLNQDHH